MEVSSEIEGKFAGIPQLDCEPAKGWLPEPEPSEEESKRNAEIILLACEMIRERWPRLPEGHRHCEVDVRVGSAENGRVIRQRIGGK